MGTTAQLKHSLASTPVGEQQWIHATALAYHGHGLLILGAPGSGKSNLALACLQQGFRLIADDAVILYEKSQQIWAQACLDTQGLLHSRSHGLINVNTQFGANALLTTAPLEIRFTLDHNSHPLNNESGLLHHPQLKKQHLPHHNSAQRLKSVLQFMQQYDSARRSGNL